MQVSDKSADVVVCEKLSNFLRFFPGRRPKPVSKRNRRGGVLETFPGELLPCPSYSSLHDDPDVTTAKMIEAMMEGYGQIRLPPALARARARWGDDAGEGVT